MRELAVWHDEMHRVRHEHHQQDATRCAREVRTRASGRVLLVALLSMFVVFVTPISALADTINAQVISGPSQVPILDMYGASIAAPDRYTAAALLMGYGPDAISGWDDDIKAKLSNASTGGQFYTFATNSVQNYFDFTEHTGIFQDFFNFVGGAFWNTAQTLYGNNLWAALYTSDELAFAKADLIRVLSGGDTGGGSSGDEVDGYTILRGGTENGYQFTLVPVATGGTGSYILDISRNTTDLDRWRSANLTIAAGAKRKNDSTVKYPIFIGFETGINLVRAPNGSVGLYNSSDTVKTYSYIRYNLDWDWSVGSDGMIHMTGGGNTSGNGNTLASKAFTTIYGTNLSQIDYFCCQGGSSTPVVPPTNWPEEPEAPEPPELPEPGDPVVEPPEPYEPSSGPTFIWNITNTSEPTDTSDLLEWIKKIFYELKAIHSDLKTWFENLGDAISDGFEAMDNACGQIYDAITENTDELKNQFQALKTYLRQLFNWLGEKMNFQASGYDDTSVIYWLKRIWSKLGNGDINVRPTDPTTDPTGVWDWLLKLIQNFLIGLASTTNDLISEFADLISQVMHQFPFSIPWDIAAFLAAFAAAPLTPEFDVNIPAIQGWWPELNFHIDLSPYDTAAATIRAIEKILFAAYLVWRSKDLLDFMDVSKWFNG